MFFLNRKYFFQLNRPRCYSNESFERRPSGSGEAGETLAFPLLSKIHYFSWFPSEIWHISAFSLPTFKVVPPALVREMDVLCQLGKFQNTRNCWFHYSFDLSQVFPCFASRTSCHTTLFQRSSNVHNVYITLDGRLNNLVCRLGNPFNVLLDSFVNTVDSE